MEGNAVSAMLAQTLATLGVDLNSVLTSGFALYGSLLLGAVTFSIAVGLVWKAKAFFTRGT